MIEIPYATYAYLEQHIGQKVAEMMERSDDGRWGIRIGDTLFIRDRKIT